MNSWNWRFLSGGRFPGPFSLPVGGLLTFVAMVLAQRLADKKIRPLSAFLASLLVTVTQPAATALTNEGLFRLYRYVEARRHGDRPEDVPYPFDGPRELRVLNRVVPIGQSEQVGDATIQMLSLEIYDEGGILNTRVLTGRERTESPPVGPYWEWEDHRHPDLALRVVDDRGGSYPALQGGGGGGDAEWRMSYQIPAPFDPAARELTIEVQSILWSTFGPMGQTGRHEIQHGPWTFRVSL